MLAVGVWDSRYILASIAASAAQFILKIQISSVTPVLSRALLPREGALNIHTAVISGRGERAMLIARSQTQHALQHPSGPQHRSFCSFGIYLTSAMSNSISKAHILPSSSLQEDSLINPGQSYHQQAQFPVHHRLIVTTTQGVYTWGAAGIFEMFHSGSSGIVAAKKLGADQGRLAIADSQVVVLHDVHKGMQRSYRLKGSEVITSTLWRGQQLTRLRVKSDY